MLINMAVSFKLPSLIKSKKKAKPDHGLPSFCWDDVTLERELDSGAFGTVYLGNYARTKETQGESKDGKRRFIKEGQMLNDLKGHRNISQFSAFCDNPFAIMMEYSVFDFNAFGENKEVTTLEDFIHFVDTVMSTTFLHSPN